MHKLQYKYYLLTLLTIVATFNFLDRIVLSLLLEPIKQEFQLSDSQLGFLTGFAFALFYAVAGVPIARWADRGNRNTIVSLTTALWSCMVALSGLVGSFTQLLLVRVGVAVGEAGCVPPAHSWISDYFSRNERPRAMAIYSLCFPAAVTLGYLGGGFLAERLGWRATFIVIGLPGIVLAVLVKLTLPEPRLKNSIATVSAIPSFNNVIATLWKQHTFLHITMGFLLAYLFGFGILTWLPTFFIRSHGMEAAEIGMWLALTNGVCALIGTYLGGVLATRYLLGKESLQMRITALLFVIASLLYVLAYLSPSKYVALGCIASLAILTSLPSGMIFSAIQSMVSVRMRSVALALVFLLANLVGAGFGPLLAGVFSDGFTPTFGEESLRYALVALSPGYLWVAYHFWTAGNNIEADIRLVDSQADEMTIELALLET